MAAHDRRADLSSARVRAVTPDGTAIEPVLPLDKTSSAGTLVIFRNVPAGPATITLDGRTWETAHTPVSVVSQRTVVSESGLETTPAACLAARYQPPAANLDLDRASPLHCPDDAVAAASTGVVFTLYKCPESKSTDDLSRCAVYVRREVPPGQDAKTEFPGLSAGSYVVEASHETFGAVRAARYLRPKDDVVVDLVPTIRPLVGRVLRLGQPLPYAKVIFHEDTPNRSMLVANGHGEFTGFLKAPIDGIDPVTVMTCDGLTRFSFKEEDPPEPGETYTIVVPANRLTVKVRDAQTSRPLAGALARFIVPKSEKAERFAEVLPAGDDGVATFQNVPPERDLDVCARLSGYRMACTATRIRLAEDEERTVDLVMYRDGSKKGRVAGLTLDIGFVYWVESVTGAVQEINRLNSDGTFYCDIDHKFTEHAVITSTNRPLIVVPPAAIERNEETITIGLPPIPRLRTFTIEMPPKDRYLRRIVTIAVGGLLVPLEAFAFHQNNRGLHEMPSKTTPLQVPDVAETAPITILLGPATEELAPNYRVYSDVFARPEYAPLIRRIAVP